MNNRTFGVLTGLSSGLLGAIYTIFLGWIMVTKDFLELSEAILVAPLLSAFLHDAFSSIWMMILMGIKGELVTSFKKLKLRSGWFVVLGSILGGPIGMSFYVLAVQNIGPSLSASISAAFPAVGAFFAYILLRDKLSLKNWFGLVTSITCIILLSVSGELITSTAISIGLVYILFNILGWGLESVILAYGMKDDEITPLQSVLIRQTVSAVVFGVIVIPVLVGHTYTIQIATTHAFWLIGLSALLYTLSYLFYYQSIKIIGPVRGMALFITNGAWVIILGVFFMEQTFQLNQFLLALLIIAGSILTVISNNKNRERGIEFEGNYFGSRHGDAIKATNQ